MRTFVVILAQGSQKRLPELTVAKQMLPLPACNNVPILHRTIRQVWALLAPTMTEGSPNRISVVTWRELSEQIATYGIPIVPVGTPNWIDGLHHQITREAANTLDVAMRYHPMVKTLPDPGNSSLKGIAEYLRHAQIVIGQYDRVVVLLGDVVYSWACLRAILDGTHWHMGFVGTSDLSRDGGELWGLSWEKTAEEPMLHSLSDALARHPKFTEYQPGQMRRWLWAFDEFMHREFGQAMEPRNWYVPIDDYTRDIDLPEHVKQLGALSEHAAADDRENGVAW